MEVVHSVVLVYFASQVSRGVMPRRGWSAIETPNGWFEVIRGPRPPSVKWPITTKGQGKGKGKARFWRVLDLNPPPPPGKTVDFGTDPQPMSMTIDLP